MLPSKDPLVRESVTHAAFALAVQATVEFTKTW
jgi:hypothetical protein